MRAKIKNKLVIDPCWEGIDFSSDKFAELDQEITKGLNQVVARHLAFAHTQHFDIIATHRGAAAIDNSSINNGSN